MSLISKILFIKILILVSLEDNKTVPKVGKIYIIQLLQQYSLKFISCSKFSLILMKDYTNHLAF